ncbi:MAG: right-handed parallel beta-helix repeat-containing protein, partial [Bauldia sp.]|nr:right-handed parallel beta-helix repeat-containing protein [Bauldia sp.]
ALMFSSDLTVRGNVSEGDRDHGIMLNYVNDAVITDNLVRGGGEKCLFMYNAHKNALRDNRFEGCPIGIHFTAGSERNVISGNAFVGNRNQVKYVGTSAQEWSEDGRGNYWSDFAGFDLNADGIADQAYRPNDLIDNVLWTQPAASLLLGSPAAQLIRWAQREFPGLLPGGVVDSAPLMSPAPLAAEVPS